MNDAIAGIEAALASPQAMDAYLEVRSAQEVINDIRALRPEPSAADALSPATEVRREAIGLADHDEIGRLVLAQPWEVQQAIVTIAAHCTALTDECPTGQVADLAGCISLCCLELAHALPCADEAAKGK